MNALTRSLSAYWISSIGKKFIVALTGLVLVLFLAGHLTGNLVVFLGREPFNDYAQFLHHFLHGGGVWLARIGLLFCLVLHVWATILLTMQNKAARQPYAYKNTIKATKSSRMMIWSGLTILAFVVYHLMHFTLHLGNSYGSDEYTYVYNGAKRHDAWKMVIDGFSVWYVVLFYAISMTLLCSHLGHGVQSIFQTLGLRTRKSEGFIRLLSQGYSFFIWAGFLSIPVAIFFFKFGR